MSNKYREITEKLQEMGASDTYINKVLEAVPFEFGIANCNLSGKLSHTNITLFKAGQMSPFNKEGTGFTMNQLIIETPDNNISQWTTNPLVIKLLHDRYHENIIEAVSIISTEIVNTFEIKDNMTIPYGLQ